MVERFESVLEILEFQAGWVTNRLIPPVLILGNLYGVETGIRNLIRAEPLETQTYRTVQGSIVLPTLHEMARIKAWLVLTRNATRDYIDFVALADKIEQRDGSGGVVNALQSMDRLYPQKNDTSVVLQLSKQLAEPKPKDLGSEDLSDYRLISQRWKDWKTVESVANRYGVILLFKCERDARSDAKDVNQRGR